MGKPTNTKKEGCATTSSNCVIWQGPELCCINLCPGDTVSDVVDKMAKKLCQLIEIVNPDNYDLSCITDAACGPGNFIDVIQLLIEQICMLRDAQGSEGGNSSSGCPDCEIAVAQCFQEQYGEVMQMTDYVAALGVKICDQAITIQTQNTAIQQMLTRITNLETQVTQLIQG